LVGWASCPSHQLVKRIFARGLLVWRSHLLVWRSHLLVWRSHLLIAFIPLLQEPLPQATI
ncbi:hypothetical protein, partial [Microcoleus sp.]|uniref:hypothetical protein n=1 Tax=Microcoleus sp. TaxID=44472 RepID=UPI00403E7296